MLNNLPEYATRDQIIDIANLMRQRSGIPPIKHTNHASARLARVPKIGTRGKYRYHLKTALELLLKSKNSWGLKVHRNATQKELDSGRLINLAEGCHLLKTNPTRLRSQITHLNIFTVAHPQTGRILADWRQLVEKCYFRSKTFIKKHTTKDQYIHIISSRPYIQHKHNGCGTSRSYFVPELSHLGSINTRYKDKKIKPGHPTTTP